MIYSSMLHLLYYIVNESSQTSRASLDTLGICEFVNNVQIPNTMGMQHVRFLHKP
uniref:Uncharacterized protein n=1 Tax=Anguilla anguilla TaxID=7936 RepID=A0A0E9WMB1_ANGAN